jgi:hypothetical protein
VSSLRCRCPRAEHCALLNGHGHRWTRAGYRAALCDVRASEAARVLADRIDNLAVLGRVAALESATSLPAI